MKCDKCNKKATVHLTEIVDGKVMEMHLCEECARDQSQQMEQQFGLADLLAGLTDFGKQVPEMQKTVLKCPSCGLTYDDFRKFGRFGCAQCYVAFQAQLKNLLKKIHGSNAHLGKQPPTSGEMQPIGESITEGETPESFGETLDPENDSVEFLRAELLKAIENEDFETAAKLRDRIRAMEQK